MTQEEIYTNSNEFEYYSVVCDISSAIKKDKELIIEEAKRTHKESFEELYIEDSLAPQYVRIYLNEHDEIVYGMVVYTIKYKKGNKERMACGNYYPFLRISEEKGILTPHPFQARICW